MNRCTWVKLDNPLYVAYHDNEWGVPVHDDIKLFEFLILEGAQAGLSWETILNKREGYRKAFKNFDPKKIVKMSDKEINALYSNPDIVRNKLKIKSVVTNAQAFLSVQNEFGSFSKYIWNFVGHKQINGNRKSSGEILAQTDLSVTISKDLKKRGFNFVGPTIVYAFMQAVGMVNDHIKDCFRYKRVLNFK